MVHNTVRELKFYFSRETAEEPLVDIYETDDDLVLKVDLPGRDPDRISVKVVDDTVVLEGSACDEAAAGAIRYLCMERRRGGFRRSISMPVRVDVHAARAFYSAGVLTVTFPKIKERVVRIEIERR